MNPHFNNWDSLCVLATACEVLARRIVHLAEPEKIKNILSNRYQHRRVDGDESEMSSALELAIDQHWYNFFFLQSSSTCAHEYFLLFKYHILVFQWSARRCVQLRPMEMRRFMLSLQSSTPCGGVTWSKLITRIMTLNVSRCLSYIPRSSHSTWLRRCTIFWHSWADLLWPSEPFSFVSSKVCTLFFHNQIRSNWTLPDTKIGFALLSGYSSYLYTL